MSTELQAIADAIRANERFVVLTHVHPDGDALGSALALARALRVLGKDVYLWHSEGVPTSYSFLKGDWSELPPADIEERVAIAVDCGDRSRVADTLEDGSGLLEQGLISIQLDHHETNPGFADLNVVRVDVPATCELLPELFALLGVPLSPEIAAPLYVGLHTDTGGFRYRAVTDRTHALKAQLGQQLNLAELDELITAAPASWVDYAERCAARAVYLSPEVAFSVMTRADLSECGVLDGETQEATTLAISKLEQTEALFHIFVYERPNGARFVSLRCQSEVVHAGELAAAFGGGGHRTAAGLPTALAPAEIAAQILAAYRTARAV